MPNVKRSDCPLSCFLDHWGDKWTFLILRDLLSGPKKFSDFLESPEPLPTNLLSSRLARLVEDGYVVKTQYQDRPKRYEYGMKGTGRRLVPVMQAMVDWAETHLEGLEDAPDGIKPLRAKPVRKVPRLRVVKTDTNQGAFEF